MVDYKGKIVYIFCLVLFAILGIGVGYFKTVKLSGVELNNTTALDYAREYVFTFTPQRTVTASANVASVTVYYVDYYTVCKDEIKTSKVYNGTTIEGVKEQEKEYQEEKGLLYEIDSETEDSITYIREVKGNCPNHFYVIYEQDKLNIYTIKGEGKHELYTSLDSINVDNIRSELKVMIERGAIFNSKEELNRFIEDLET